MMRRKPFLRHYADEALPLVRAIQENMDELTRARAEGDPVALIPILGELGEAFRLLGQLDRALPYTTEALELARAQGRAKWVLTNGLRLATLLQYRNDHAAAEPLFIEALAGARALGLLEDFVLQHWGKCLAELGRRDEAIACFERALVLRQTRGDAALIASTEEALDLARTFASTMDSKVP